VTDSLGYLLYGLFAIGGAGVYLALPRSGRSARTAGAILGLAAVALLIVLLAAQAVPPQHSVYSYIFAALALLAAGRVVTHPKPVYSALYFVLVVVAVAFLAVLKHAEFLAVALIIVYAGAILVTYAFVLMLAQQSGAPPYDTRAREPFLAVLAGFVTMAAVAGQVGTLPPATTPAGDPDPGIWLARGAESDMDPPPEPEPAAEPPGNTEAVGAALLTTYVVTLEVAGVLLLVAMIGAIVIVKKRVPSEEVIAEEKPLGQIGREVPPF